MARRLGGPIEPFVLATPREAGVAWMVDLLRSGAPMGEVTAVFDRYARQFEAQMLGRLGAVDRVVVSRIIGMWSEAVRAAGGVVALPVDEPVDEFDDVYGTVMPAQVRRDL